MKRWVAFGLLALAAGGLWQVCSHVWPVPARAVEVVGAVSPLAFSSSGTGLWLRDQPEDERRCDRGEWPNGTIFYQDVQGYWRGIPPTFKGAESKVTGAARKKRGTDG